MGKYIPTSVLSNVLYRAYINLKLYVQEQGGPDFAYNMCNDF